MNVQTLAVLGATPNSFLPYSVVPRQSFPPPSNCHITQLTPPVGVLSAQNPHSCVRPSPSGCSWLTCNLTPHLPQFHCYPHCECKVINMSSYFTPYARAYSTHLLESILKHKVLNIDQYFTPWLICQSLCHSVLTNTPRLVILFWSTFHFIMNKLTGNLEKPFTGHP